MKDNYFFLTFLAACKLCPQPLRAYGKDITTLVSGNSDAWSHMTVDVGMLKYLSLMARYAMRYLNKQILDIIE